MHHDNFLLKSASDWPFGESRSTGFLSTWEQNFELLFNSFSLFLSSLFHSNGCISELFYFRSKVSVLLKLFVKRSRISGSKLIDRFSKFIALAGTTISFQHLSRKYWWTKSWKVCPLFFYIYIKYFSPLGRRSRFINQLRVDCWILK